jgi:hypothetical protein
MIPAAASLPNNAVFVPEPHHQGQFTLSTVTIHFLSSFHHVEQLPALPSLP